MSSLARVSLPGTGSAFGSLWRVFGMAALKAAQISEFKATDSSATICFFTHEACAPSLAAAAARAEVVRAVP